MTDTPLSDDVVHAVERAIKRFVATNWRWKAAEEAARAALEAARYGEIVEALKDARRTMYDEAAISKRIDALLSSIGASHES